MSPSPDNNPAAPLIHGGPFVYVILTPLMVWGVLVGVLWFAKQPGVVCITPLAWLLAFWSGTQYVNLSQGVPDRYPLLAPLLIGAAVGLGEGILFIVVTSLGMPATTPEDAVKAQVISAGILVAGILLCAGLCALTAMLRLRSYAREQIPPPG